MTLTILLLLVAYVLGGASGIALVALLSIGGRKHPRIDPRSLSPLERVTLS